MIVVVIAVLWMIEPPLPATDPVTSLLAGIQGAILLVPGIVDFRNEGFPAILAVTCIHGRPPCHEF